MWVYRYENNQVYVILQKILRGFTRKLPDYVLDKFSHLLRYIFDFYGRTSKIFFLPLTPFRLF